MAHGVARSEPCALQMALDFLDDPLQAPGAACMDGLEEVEFR
jgi:hypothetical protein